MKGRIGEEEMERQLNYFLIILLLILDCFFGGKSHDPGQRPEQKITALPSKKVTKTKEEIKKSKSLISKSMSKEIVDFVWSPN